MKPIRFILDEPWKTYDPDATRRWEAAKSQVRQRISPQRSSNGDGPIPGLPHCGTCHDKGFVTHRVPIEHPDFGKAFPCPDCAGGKLAEQRRLDALFREANFTESYRAYTLVDFYSLPDRERGGKETAIDAAGRWAADESIAYADYGLSDPGAYDTFPRRSLVLYGRPGTGKTTLAAAAFRARLERERAGLLVEFYALAGAIQAQYGSDTDESSTLIAAAQNAPLLMIDDLGDIDRVRFQESDDKRRILYGIVNHRVSLNMPTIITTNLTAEDVARQFGERIKERLQQMAVWLVLRGAKLRPGVPDLEMEQW